MPYSDSEAPEASSVPPEEPRLPWWRRAVKLPLRASHRRQAARKNESRQDKVLRRTANATIAIAAATVVAASVGIAQWRILSGQLEEMREERRAWLRIGSIEPSGAIVIHGNIIGVAINYNLHGLGKMPATSVVFQTRLAIKPYGARNLEALFSFDFLSEARTNCNFGKILFSNEISSEFGDTVFPDEGTPTTDRVVTTNYDEFSKRKMSQGDQFNIYLEACVVYASGADSEPHETASTYLITRGSNVVDYIFTTAMLPIPAGKWHLVRTNASAAD